MRKRKGTTTTTLIIIITTTTNKRKTCWVQSLFVSPLSLSLIHTFISFNPLLNIFIILFLIDNWSVKSHRRRTTGTGRKRYLKTLVRRFHAGFREGAVAKRATVAKVEKKAEKKN